MLIVPGFAVPVGTNLYNFIINNLDFWKLFENFYIIENGNFFIILIIQQTCFGFLGGLNQISILLDFYLSPTAFFLIKKNKGKRVFHKNERDTFKISYRYAMSLIILGIIVIYGYFKKSQNSACFVFWDFLFCFEVFC